MKKNELGKKAKPAAANGAAAQPAAAAGGKKVTKAVKAAPKKASAAKAAAVAVKETARKPLRGGIPFICSECYEEFLLPATYSKDTVSCPECMHVGKRPDDNFLRTVSAHKRSEGGAFKMALTGIYLVFLSICLLIWLASPYSQRFVAAEQRGNYTYILLGLAAFAIAFLGYSVAKYEKNRWDIYF